MPNQKESFLTVDEVSQLLRIQKSTVYKKCFLKEIPHYKIGSRTLFKESELMDQVNGNRVSTNSEIEAKAAGY
ncbi:MAG: helix-turn-helix domain-containing protein [Melioribacteraceae bacterium]|nr:MAG: helix-turn-helix domain-containing protein [Melioribacteraceae bacterium]